MANYEPIEAGVEVNGQTVLSVVNAFPNALQERGEDILASHGIDEAETDEWYQQEAWLNAFSELAESMGKSTLEQIGKQIPKMQNGRKGPTQLLGVLNQLTRRIT